MWLFVNRYMLQMKEIIVSRRLLKQQEMLLFATRYIIIIGGIGGIEVLKRHHSVK